MVQESGLDLLDGSVSDHYVDNERVKSRRRIAPYQIFSVFEWTSLPSPEAAKSWWPHGLSLMLHTPACQLPASILIVAIGILVMVVCCSH
jgi:hypothetical protein